MEKVFRQRPMYDRLGHARADRRARQARIQVNPGLALLDLQPDVTAGRGEARLTRCRSVAGDSEIGGAQGIADDLPVAGTFRYDRVKKGLSCHHAALGLGREGLRVETEVGQHAGFQLLALAFGHDRTRRQCAHAVDQPRRHVDGQFGLREAHRMAVRAEQRRQKHALVGGTAGSGHQRAPRPAQHAGIGVVSDVIANEAK